MTPELSPSSMCTSSEVKVEQPDVRGAMACIMETLLGQRTLPNYTSTGPSKRLGKFRPHNRATATSITGPVVRVETPARLEIVERLSRETLAIYWSDARTGRYADQLWRLGRARVRSFCVLSGAPIEVGDSVYRPKSQGTNGPANRDFMILAQVVEEVYPDRETI